MGLKTPPINLRLPGDLGRRFEALRREFPGLPAGVVLRMLLADQLRKPMSEQVEIVVREIRRPPGGRSSDPPKPGTNTRNRMANA